MPPESTVIIAANPKSGARSGLGLASALRDALERRGYVAELFTDVDEMARRAQASRREGTLRTVVSAGGDGTASLVLSKIPAATPLTLFPLGSENLAAKYFGMTSRVDETVLKIDRLRTEPLDLFLANGRLTLLVASVGFDAEVVRQVHENRQSHVNRTAYHRGILRTMFRYQWPRFQVRFLAPDGAWGEAIEGNWVFAFNVPRYAAGIRIIESTSISDGLLDVGLFRGGGLCRGLLNYAMVVAGVHQRVPSWRRFQTSGLRVELASRDAPAGQPAEDRDVAFQIDGDPGGFLPLEVVYSGRKAMIVSGNGS